MTNKKDTGEQKRKVSVALEYVPGEEAPKIIASGKGVLAEKIIERAKEADVPVYEDSKLANTLSKLEIGDMIPPELYSVVAEILVFVDDMDRLRSKVKQENNEHTTAGKRMGTEGVPVFKGQRLFYRRCKFRLCLR